MIKLFFSFFIAIGFLFSNIEQININDADYNSIINLPIEDSSKLILIAEFMMEHGQIENIYELLTIPSITSTEIEQLKPFIYVKSDDLTTFKNRLETNTFDYGNFLNEDGNMSNASQYWLDMVLYPEDINDLGYYDLINLPILSPLDVASVLKQKSNFEIRSDFVLKNADGISRYGLKKLRKFITYPQKNLHPNQNNTRIHVDVNTRPRTSGSDSESTEFKNANASIPEIYTTIRTNSGNNLISGVSYFRTMGQPSLNQTEFIKSKELKA